MHNYSLFYTLLGITLVSVVSGCRPSATNEVIVYTALDREFAEPIFQTFTDDTGIEVQAVYDSEANKSVGLAQRIENERRRPICDLFWNNEILNTVQLARRGLLDAYVPAVAADYPPTVRSPDGLWHGFAARARVLLVNTQLVAEEDVPTSIEDLMDARWDGRMGMAKPLFGTTKTHAACLYSHWGADRANQFFRSVRQHARIFPGNRQVARAVSSRQIAFGLTDTDDAIIEIEQGMPVSIVYPDQHPRGMGTLFIPNTLSLVRGGQHPDAARKLVDYLLSPATESRLAQGRSAQIPLNRQVDTHVRVATPSTVRPMAIDFSVVAEEWDRTGVALRKIFP